MSSEKMCDRIVDTMERGFKEFKPRPSHEIKKVEEVLSKRITHKLTGY